MKCICVFCGSNSGNDPAYWEATRSLGKTLADVGISLDYGGGHVGLMGVVADATLGAGGEAIGVMPRSLVKREIAHNGLTQLHVVGSMHERKALMSELSGGFVALPGGTGTMEEFFEVLTWAQLGGHRKPCGLLNVAGYYDPLLAFFDQMVDKRFLSEINRSIVLVDTEPSALLERFEEHEPPMPPKWIEKSET